MNRKYVKKYHKKFLSTSLGGVSGILPIFEWIQNKNQESGFKIRMNGQLRWINLEEFEKQDADLFMYILPDAIMIIDYERKPEHQEIGKLIDELGINELNEFIDIAWWVIINHYSDGDVTSSVGST